MSISYTIDKSLKRITVVVEGDYTNDDLKSFTERVWSNPVRDGISGFDQLCLHNNASYIGNNMDIVELTEYRNKFDAQGEIGKTALDLFRISFIRLCCRLLLQRSSTFGAKC